ncbi:MAG TPA: hypothetical protein VH396_02875 [Chitinophagaceae bacterium]|jgi:hypothetical protein
MRSNVITGRYLDTIGKTGKIVKDKFFMAVKKVAVQSAFSWYRIIPATAPRPASGDSFYSKPAAFN